MRPDICECDKRATGEPPELIRSVEPKRAVFGRLSPDHTIIRCACCFSRVRRKGTAIRHEVPIADAQYADSSPLMRLISPLCTSFMALRRSGTNGSRSARRFDLPRRIRIAIVQQCLKRNTCAAEDWGPAENLRVLHNHFVAMIHAGYLWVGCLNTSLLSAGPRHGSLTEAAGLDPVRSTEACAPWSQSPSAFRRHLPHAINQFAPISSNMRDASLAGSAARVIWRPMTR